MNNPNIEILSWNVCGLNSSERCLALHETVAATPCQIVCLQETKLQSIDSPLVFFLGAYKLDNFALKPVAWTRCGIIFALEGRRDRYVQCPRRSRYDTA
jgi:exonuclease III